MTMTESISMTRRSHRITKVWNPTYEELYRAWAVEHLTIKQIACRYGVAIPTVSKRLEKLKIRDIVRKETWCTKEMLWQDYVVDRIPREKIAEKYNVSTSTVYDKLRFFGITARDRTK